MARVAVFGGGSLAFLALLLMAIAAVLAPASAQMAADMPSLSIPAAQSAQMSTVTLYKVGETITIPAGPHSSPEHDPYTVGTQANQMFAALIATWATTVNGPQFDPNQTRCFVLYVGDAAARLLYWSYTNSSATGIPRGNLMWYHASDMTPGGGYANKSGNTLTNVPGDIQKDYPNSRIVENDCRNFPPPGNFATH